MPVPPGDPNSWAPLPSSGQVLPFPAALSPRCPLSWGSRNRLRPVPRILRGTTAVPRGNTSGTGPRGEEDGESCERVWG